MSNREIDVRKYEHLDTIGKRLSYVFNAYTQKEFTSVAKMLDVADRTVRNWITDKQPISLRYILAIRDYSPSLNLHWFLTGEGEPYTSDNLTDNEVKENSNYRKEINELKDKQEKILSWIDSMNNFMKMGKNYDVDDRATA